MSGQLAHISRRSHVVLGAIAVAAAVAATWPVVTHLRDHVVDATRFWFPTPASSSNWIAHNFRADVFLTVWIVNWNLHALITQPLALFNANIFYPAPLALARAEHMFATSVLGVPGALASGPVAAHQTAFVLTSLLNAWTSGYVMLRWSGSLLGAVVAATSFALSPFQQNAPSDLQSQGAGYFALILLGLERFAATGAPRWAALGGAALVLQVLSGQYLGYYALGVWTLCGGIALFSGRSTERPFRRLGRDGGWLLGLTAAAAVALLPFAIPYLRLTVARELPDNLTGQARVWTIAASVGSLREYVVGGALPGTRIAPGVLLLAGVGLVALASGMRENRIRAAMIMAVGLGGAVLALGPRPKGFGIHEFLSAIVPGFRSVRGPSRAIVLVHFAAAMLAGFGAATLARRRPIVGGLVACGLVATALVSQWRGPLPLMRVAVGAELPPAYRYLARCGAGDPLLELPPHTGSENWRDAERVFYSTYHWLPLLNGRTGYAPPLFGTVMALAERVPDPQATRELRHLTGVRWLLVDCSREARERQQAARLCGGERVLGTDGEVLGDRRLFDLGSMPALPRPSPRRPAPEDCRRRRG